MTRHRLALISLLCLLTFCICLYAQVKPQDPVIARRAPQRIKPTLIEGVKLRTREIAISRRVLDSMCGKREKQIQKTSFAAAVYKPAVHGARHFEMTAADMQGGLEIKDVEDPSALVCETVHEVEVNVIGGKSVTVDPDPVRLVQGECVRWRLAAGINAKSLLINFVDSKQEASDFSKEPIAYGVNDVCQNTGVDCLVYVALGGGEKTWAVYSYVVTVIDQAGRSVSSDPEMMVSCSGCMGPY